MNTKKIVSIRFLGKITFRVCIVLLLEYFAKARAKTKKYNSKKKVYETEYLLDAIINYHMLLCTHQYFNAF